MEVPPLSTKPGFMAETSEAHRFHKNEYCVLKCNSCLPCKTTESKNQPQETSNLTVPKLGLWGKQEGKGLPRWLSDKEFACQFRSQPQEMWVQSLGQEDPLEKEMAPTPVFLPGESYGHRSLVGYSPQGRRRVTHNLVTKHHHQQEEEVKIRNTSQQK